MSKIEITETDRTCNAIVIIAIAIVIIAIVITAVVIIAIVTNNNATRTRIGRNCALALRLTHRYTVSFHNFKSPNFKLSVSHPKSKYVAYLSVLSQISNCQSLGRKNKHDCLKTDRIGCCIVAGNLRHYC